MVIQHALTLALLLPTAAPAPLAAAPAAVQDDQVPDKREEVKAMIDELKGHAKKRAKEDEQAVGVIDRLIVEFPKSGPKDREDIVDSLEWCFGQKRPKELAEGVPDTRLYVAAAVGLGEMGPESVKPLIKLIDAKTIKKAPDARGAVIKSLGKTRDLDGVKPLVDLLKDKDAGIVASAAQALGYFDGAPLKVRKQAFEELLKMLMSAKGQTDSDPNDPISRERYYAISASIITSLGVLSGHEARQPEEWQRWWNKNKKKDWDEEED